MASLTFNVAAIHLAQALYYSRAEAYGLALTSEWEQLAPREKHDYVEQAQLALEAVRPAPNTTNYFGLAASLARRERDKVIARITPEAPYGEEIA